MRKICAKFNKIMRKICAILIDKRRKILYYIIGVRCVSELKEIRLSVKMTQNEAANLLNISRRTYQKYELMNDDNDEKLKYYIYRFQKLTEINENTGILTIPSIKEITSNILKKYDIKSCFLFGSYAKGKATEVSDIDLLIDSDITGLDYYGLIEELRDSLHKKIDLLTIKSIANNPEMLIEIIRYGIKIYR